MLKDMSGLGGRGRCGPRIPWTYGNGRWGHCRTIERLATMQVTVVCLVLLSKRRFHKEIIRCLYRSGHAVVIARHEMVRGLWGL